MDAPSIPTSIPMQEPSQEALDALGTGPVHIPDPAVVEARVQAALAAGRAGVKVATPPTQKGLYDDAVNEVMAQHASADSAANQAPVDYTEAVNTVLAQNHGATVDAEKDEALKADLLRWRVLNEKRAPEEQAEVLRLSSALGWNPEVVAGDLPAARRAVDASGMDAEDVVRAHPALADFIGDPRTTALARGDTARLMGLSYLVGQGATPGVVELMFKQRALARETHDLQAQLLGGYVPDADAPAPPVDLSGEGVSQEPLRPMTDAEKAQVSQRIQENTEKLKQLSSAGDGINELSGWGPRQVAKAARILIDMGPEMAKGALATAAGGLLGGVGAGATGTAYWASETAPALYWQALQIKGPDGKTPALSEQEARAWAMGGSLPIGALLGVGLEGAGAGLKGWAAGGAEAAGAGLRNLAAKTPLTERLLASLQSKVVDSVLSKPGVVGMASRFALNYGTHSAQGALVMAGQGALTQATMEAAAATHGAQVPGTIGDAFSDGFEQGLKDFAVISLWGPAGRWLSEVGKVRASQDSAAVLQDIANGTKDSKVAQNAPEEFGKLVDRFGPDKKVYVDRAAFDTFAQEKKLSPRELAAGILGDKGEAYDAAVSSNADLAIPVGRWAEKVVLPGHAEKLAPDTRWSLNEMTPRQTAESIRASVAAMQSRAEARGPSFEGEVGALRKQLYGVARDSGYEHAQADSWADQLSRYSASMSLRLDTPLRDAVVRVGLPQLRLEGRDVLSGKLADALRVTPEERAAIKMPAAQEPDGLSGLSEASLADVKAVRDAAKTPEAKAAAERLARAAYTDALVPQIGNQRAHEEFMRSEQAKSGVHVVTDMPGLKARNDKYGQLEGDRALQAYGKAFAEASREQRGKAHRMSTGDEFYAHFPDAEKAQRFIEGLKTRLSGPEGKLREGDQLSTYAGIGSSKEAAAAELVRSKAAAKAKYGDSRAGGKVGHGESFVNHDAALKPNELRSFAERVVEAARKAPEGHRFDDRSVFLHRVAEKMGENDFAAFGKKLVEAHQEGFLTLGRADLVEVMNPADVGASHIKGPHGTDFHFLRLPAEKPRNENVLAQDKRGTIQFKVGEDGRARDFDIRALKGDKSTLAHETGHWLSWSLHDLATKPGAPEDLKADYQKLLEFGGWRDTAQRLSDNKERSELAAKEKLTEGQASRLKELTAREERLSHAWETYLAEGKAPDAGLRGTFARFRRWMGGIYGSVQGIEEQYRKTYGQDLGMSNEVRGVFDRMLAVDKTVENLKADDGKLDYASVLRLTPEQADQLKSLREQKYEEARTRLDRDVISYNGDNTKGFLQAERERMRADVENEVSASGPYAASDFLRTGEFRNENGHVFEASQIPEALKGENGKPAKLSFDEAKKDVGESTAKLLLRKGLVVKDGGVGADEIAGLFGFTDGADMLRTLAGMHDKDTVVEQETARRFEEAFGPKLEQQADALKATGNDALHNPADIRETLLVRDAVARELGGGKARKLAREVLEQNAERIVRGTRIQELSQKHYLDGERRAMKEAFDLMAEAKRARDAEKKDKAAQLYGDALHKLDAALLSKMLWRKAGDALKEVDAAEAKLKRASTPAYAQKLGKGDIVYADANDAILGAVGRKDLSGAPDARTIDNVLSAIRRDSVEGTTRDENGRLESNVWDSQHIRDIVGTPVPWERATFGEAMNIVDALENIKTAALSKSELTVNGKRVERTYLLDRLDESTKKLSEVNEPVDANVLSGLKRIVEQGRKIFTAFDANLTDIESLVERLVGKDRSHPLWQLFIGDRYVARDLEHKLTNEHGARILQAWEELPKEMKKSVTKEVPGLGDALPVEGTGGILNPTSPRSRSWLWMLALNWGNAGNKQRLLDGYGWSESQVAGQLEKHMTAAEWKWVQGIWDSLTPLYPEIERVHIEDTGARPTKVEAVPFSMRTADGQVAELGGGYFPARYDPRPVSKNYIGEKQEAAGLQAILTPNYRTAKVATGHAQERAEQNADRLNLDFNVVPAHVSQVIHDISHRMLVKNIGAVVLDPRFQEIVRGRMGKVYAEQFPSWLKGVASQYATNAQDPMRAVNAIFSWTKSKATLGAVGFNVSVPLSDLTNPLMPVAGGELSAIHLARATRQLATNWSELRQFALDSSLQLRLRNEESANGLGIDLKGLTKSKGMLGDVERASYWMMEQSDRITSTTTWTAKYQELLEAGASHEDATRDADALIRKYFPGTDATMRANWLRDKGLIGSLTFLYGFGNKMYNVNRALILNAADAYREPGATVGDKAKAIGAAMGLMVMQGFVVGGISDFLSGHGPQEGEDDHWKDLKERAQAFAGYQLPGLQLFVGGKGLPSSGLLKQFKAEAEGAWTGQTGTYETLAYLGSLLALRGVGTSAAVRAGKYLDKNGLGDLAHGAPFRFASGLAFGDRGAVTPINLPDVLRNKQ